MGHRDGLDIYEQCLYTSKDHQARSKETQAEKNYLKKTGSEVERNT